MRNKCGVQVVLMQIIEKIGKDRVEGKFGQIGLPVHKY